MSNNTPYLQRRGNTFSLRIAVPIDLLGIVGKQEFIKSLQTTDKNIAVPLALSHAAMAKQLFYELKHMPDSDKNKKLIELLREKKHKIQFEEQDDSSKAT